MDDRFLFNSKEIQITKTLAKFGRTTYPINGIGAVSLVEPNRRGMYIFAVLLAIVGVSMLANNNGSAGGGVGVLIFGGLIALAAYRRPTELMLHTASGDRPALKSRDQKLLEEIKGAIETAATMRG